jgi:hypothetical protein
MKYVIILALLAYSCTPQFHVNKAKKHTAKAIDKGAVLTPSIDSLLIYDTIITIRTFRINDTVHIETIKTIEKVVYQVGEIRYITKKDKRKEARQVKVASRREFKLDKSKQKTERVVARVKNRKFPYWIIILILALIIILFVYEKKRQKN